RRRDGVVPLAATIHVEVNAPIRRAALDIGDLYAARKGVDVNRPGPERRSIRRREGIGTVAEVDLKLVAGLEVQVGEVKHQQLRATGRRGRAERGGARTYFLGRAQHLKRARNVRHRGPPYARRGAICSTSMETPTESSPAAVYTAGTAIGPFDVISRNPIVIGIGDAASPPKRSSAIRQQSSIVAVWGGRTILSPARAATSLGSRPPGAPASTTGMNRF